MFLSLDALERRIAVSGHRITAPRRTLLDSMQQLGDHFTAEQLAAAAPGVGRATVFRTLRLLQEIGTVCQVILDDRTLEYRLASGGHHHHAVCSECGSVDDFENADIEVLLHALASLTGFTIETHRLELYGRCAPCTARLAGAELPIG